MPVFKDGTKEIIVKLVFYGPGLAGKSTSLKSLHQQTDPERHGEFHTWGHEDDTILDFDLLPLSLTEIKTFKLCFQVYTVPGQVKSNRTRKFILEGVDAIVFVADSRRSQQKANMISLGNLRENLRAHGLSLDDIPMVYEYNKRDLRDILTVVELNEDLNPTDRYPCVETIATKGKGVLKIFEIISNLVIRNLTNQLQFLEEEISSENDELPELLGLPDWEESFDFAAELEPVTVGKGEQPVLLYTEHVAETYHDGEIIFEQGDPGDKMYYIEKGQVKIVATYKFSQKVLALYHEGDFFGEMALFGKHYRSARAVAVGTISLLPVTKESLASQIHNKPEIAESLLQTLSDRLRKENETIVELLEQNKQLKEHLEKAREEVKQAVAQHDGLNTVDFTFSHGIDWQAFLVSFYQLYRQIKAKNKAAEFSVQGIEKKGDGGFKIKITAPQKFDKKKIYQVFMAQYKRQLNVQKAKYQTLWQGQEKGIALSRQQGTDMQKIVKTLSQHQSINIPMAQIMEMSKPNQPRSREELTYLYTVFNEKISELRRKYIREKDPTTRIKLKRLIKGTEAKLKQIEQRLED